MKRSFLSDLGASITLLSTASFYELVQHAIPFIIAVVVGILTIIEKYQVIQERRRARKPPSK